MERTLWLDGLRGLASAGVLLYHSFMYDPAELLAWLFNSYWDDPPEDNRRFLQLPPFHLLLAGSSMVSLFMVISGYAISTSLLKSRDDGAGDYLLARRLSSAATRRVLRLYLPVALVMTINQILYFGNIYKFENEMPDSYFAGLKPLLSPWAHAKYLVWSVICSLDISNHGPDINLDRAARPDYANNLLQHLWTMPVELRGSCTVYLLILTMAFWQPQPRFLALAAVAAFWLYEGQWDLFAFIVGIIFTEKDLAADVEAYGELELPGDSPPTQQPFSRARAYVANITRNIKASSYVYHAQLTASVLLGTYLLSMCDIENVAPEYRWLLRFQSPNWDSPEMRSRCWITIGAVLVIYAINQSSLLQRPLSSKPVQYLGRISFPLYLIHPMVFNTMKTRIRSLLWVLLMHESFPGTVEASKRSIHLLGVAWGGALLFCIVASILLADLWERHIDRKCLGAARRFAKWVTH
ncbi:acyltransferase 3 [Penicillium hispanicum]|uniref:acyltransferase 3 n=1 Tax=Penicillium hispanicum TaxID=1080232 RepID=UPI002541D795|nr:acyltransferase 3 [Penicillium hispanicum]KAJ5579817.1 acyltransferase 3 [Penicillium hispanicum]